MVNHEVLGYRVGDRQDRIQLRTVCRTFFGQIDLPPTAARLDDSEYTQALFEAVESYERHTCHCLPRPRFGGHHHAFLNLFAVEVSVFWDAGAMDPDLAELGQGAFCALRNSLRELSIRFDDSDRSNPEFLLDIASWFELAPESCLRKVRLCHIEPEHWVENSSAVSV